MAVGSLNPHLMASGGDVASLGYCGFRLTSVATMMMMVVIVMMTMILVIVYLLI